MENKGAKQSMPADMREAVPFLEAEYQRRKAEWQAATPAERRKLTLALARRLKVDAATRQKWLKESDPV